MDEGRIETRFTRMLGIRYPIVAAPMFLVSSPKLVAAVSGAGGLGAMPSHNFRTTELLAAGLSEIRRLTDKPFAVNIIVNQSNPYREDHARACLDAGVPMLISSMGSPRDLISDAHSCGAKVLCDVVDLSYARKVEDMGADGVVAVAAGAGGHAGRTAAQVLVPLLRESLSIPILAAGGIATGRGMLAALALGADGVYAGTRFIASDEAEVSEAYKNAILECGPEQILYTARLTGVHANFIKSKGLERMGTELMWPERLILKFGPTKRLARGLRMLYINRRMARSAQGGPKKAWKDVWSAGQTVGLVHEIAPAAQIVHDMISEYENARVLLPGLENP